MTHDLDVYLKMCEAINVGSSFFDLANFAAAAQIGWSKTIHELIQAKKRIAELEEVIEQYRVAMRVSARLR